VRDGSSALDLNLPDSAPMNPWLLAPTVVLTTEKINWIMCACGRPQLHKLSDLGAG